MSCPQARRRGEKTAGVVALFSLEVEMVVPFTGRLGCGAPFIVLSFAFGEQVGGPAAVGSADD